MNKFLQEFYVDDRNDYYNIVSMIQPRGKFSFGRKQYDYFMNEFSNQKSGIAEVPRIHIPLYFDFDIKKDTIENDEVHFYTEEQVKSIISIITSMVKKHFDVKDENLFCCLLEKDIYQKSNGKYSNGFHLHFPSIFVSRDIFRQSMLPILQSKIKQKTGLDVDDVYTNPWLLYGNVKDDKLEPYVLTKIYNVDLNQMTVFDAFKNYKIFDEEEKQIKITESNVDLLLPRIFSINAFGRNVNELVNKFDTDVPKKIVNVKPKVEDNRPLSEKAEEIKKFLPLILDNETYNNWFTIGQAIYNILEGSDEGLELFIEWSRNASNFDESGCEDKWKKMRFTNSGIGTIKHYAKLDSKVEYEEITKPKSKLVFIEKEEECPLTHQDIAIYIVEQIQKSKNIYYSVKKKCIYVYNDTYKLFEEKPFDVIMNYISFYMHPLINNKIEYSNSKISEKDSEKENLDANIDVKRIKMIDNQIKKLLKEQSVYTELLNETKSTPFQKNVLTQIKNRINNDDDFIESTFNKIKHLFPIKDNKVINLKTLEVVERTKEHYFTHTTDNIFKVDRPNKEWVYNYVSQILKTDNELFVRCFLTHLGYCMTGETCVKKFPIWTGDGDNGKSACFNVIKKIYGKFGVVGNDKVFLLQKNQAVHNDEFLPLINKRFAYIQEISKNNIFNEKLIKSITGGDGDISVRGCGGVTMQVILDCKLLCICNGDDIPDFIDKQGFMNRVMVIPFKNKFERDANKIDEINSMKDDIFTELCHYVKEFFYDNNMKIDFSVEIDLATSELKENKDTIKQFIDEKIEFTTDERDRIKKDTVYKMYLSYCKLNNMDNIKVSKVELYREFKNVYKIEIYRDREFKNIKFIKDDDLDELTNGVPL